MAAMFGGLSVILGAFAAHQLKSMLPADEVTVFETGVRYQFYHALALLAVGLAYHQFVEKWARRACNCFIIGIVLFSGSLYALTFLHANAITPAVKLIGPITPLGGLFFIGGWALLLVAAIKKREPQDQ